MKLLFCAIFTASLIDKALPPLPKSALACVVEMVWSLPKLLQRNTGSDATNLLASETTLAIKMCQPTVWLFPVHRRADVSAVRAEND